MKATELLSIGRQLLSVMSLNGIMLDDYKYVDTYHAFLNMRRNKVKYRSAIRMLAQEHGISERTLERVFKRLGKEI